MFEEDAAKRRLPSPSKAAWWHCRYISGGGRFALELGSLYFPY